MSVDILIMFLIMVFIGNRDPINLYCWEGRTDTTPISSLHLFSVEHQDFDQWKTDLANVGLGHRGTGLSIQKGKSDWSENFVFSESCYVIPTLLIVRDEGEVT